MQRGQKMLNILNALAHGSAEVTVGLIDFGIAMSVAGYGASSHRIRKEIAKLEGLREQAAERNKEEQRERQRYSSMLYKLRRDGLIQEKKQEGLALSPSKGKKSIWEITKKGIEKLRKLEERHEHIGMLPWRDYTREQGNDVIIITFDIPESKRKIRDWLRAMLLRLEYKILQKSVWIGKTKIPKEFLDDIKELKLSEYIEICAITKGGSLRQMI